MLGLKWKRPLATARVADVAANQGHNDRDNNLSRLENVVTIVWNKNYSVWGSLKLIATCA